MYNTALAGCLAEDQDAPRFDHVVVDEAQDLSVAQLRFLAALGSARPDRAFFTSGSRDSASSSSRSHGKR
jgi:superfamily I DNA/RNA helicase